MHRHQRQGQQELVFHQVVQVEMTRQRQYVVFAFGVERLGRRFVGDEAQRPCQIEVERHRLQATLAVAPDTGLHRQVQPDLGLGPSHRTLLAANRPLHDAVLGRAVVQALEAGQRPLAVEPQCVGCRSGHVESARVGRARCHAGSLRPDAV